MSRLGLKPVEVPSGVSAKLEGGKLVIKGSKGELICNLPDLVDVEISDGKLVVVRKNDSRQARNLHGLIRNLVFNMIEGVLKGFVKELEIQGVGFKAALQGKKLVLSLGFSKPAEFTVPEGISVKVNESTAIVVAGADKHMVGEVAARIRGLFPAEPYKGKGIRYKNEYVRRKEGKTMA